MAKRLGEVLKQAREKKGMKAEEVAALCNVTRGQYYQWEASAHILAKNLPALAKALRLRLSALSRLNKEGRERGRDEDASEETVSAA